MCWERLLSPIFQVRINVQPKVRHWNLSWIGAIGWKEYFIGGEEDESRVYARQLDQCRDSLCRTVWLVCSFANKHSEVVRPLLSVSPMAKNCDCDTNDDCSCDTETTEFDSETLANHIRSLFNFYDINLTGLFVKPPTIAMSTKLLHEI